jgi:hypothetical protein
MFWEIAPPGWCLACALLRSSFYPSLDPPKDVCSCWQILQLRRRCKHTGQTKSLHYSLH